VQKLQTLGLQFRPEKAHARDVAPGSIKARDEAEHDRIAGADKDNRNLRGCRLGYRCRRVFAAITSGASEARSEDASLKAAPCVAGPSLPRALVPRLRPT
jgi:hypothetical protein